MKQLLHQKVVPPCIELGSIHFENNRMDKKSMPTKSKPGVYRFIRMLSLFALLLLSIRSSVNAQTISGETSVCVGATTTLSSSVSGGDWSSSNATVATVDPGTGVVKGLAAGTATITYLLSGIPTTIDVTVKPLPNAGTISGPNSVCMNSTMTMNFGVAGGVWSTTNAIATVGSATGVVTGVAIGGDSIIYTVSNSCGSSYASVYITISGTVGDIYTFGGTGTPGTVINGTPAFQAPIHTPRDLSVNSAGDIYYCEAGNVARKITKSGIIYTIAGTGVAGNGGDGGLAVNAQVNNTNGIFADDAGNVFICNTGGNTVRKINAAGIISTIAGIPGSAGPTVSGMLATDTKLFQPIGVLEDPAGNVYISSASNLQIVKVAAGTGIISVVVGTGVSGYSGDGGPAILAQISSPRGITMDKAGNIYIADYTNNVIRKYVPSTGIITTFAGTGAPGHSGDGGPATAATLTQPARFAYDGANILYVSDQSNNVIRAINLVTGIITNVAGNATLGFSGDGNTATSGQLNTPVGIGVDHFGNFYISDANNNRIRIVPSQGSIAANITGPTSIFAGTPVTLSAFLSGSGSATYQWQKNGVNVGDGNTTYTDPYPDNGDVYSVIVSVTPVCSSDAFVNTSNAVAVSVNPVVSPISILSGTNPACTGETISLADTASGGTWTSSATSVATISPDGVVTAVSAGTTIITYALPPSALGTSSTTLNVTVNPMATITSSAGANGSITPSGTVSLCGSNQIFTITPNNGYHVTDVLVDGNSVGALTSYTFSSVSGNHTINVAGFAPDCIAPAISCSGNVTQAADAGACNAVVTYSAATATGTSPTITYSQNPGTTFGVGSTVVTATATNGCGTDNCSFTVTINPNILTVSATGANVSCNGGNNGSITTMVNGGTGSYTYSWAGKANGPNPTGLSAGTYNVTVTDAGCTSASAATTSITITEPTALMAAASAGTIACHGGTTTVTVTGSGGTGTQSGTGAFTVGAGTYNYTVTDEHGCTATATGTISEPDALIINAITPTNVSCNTANGGNHNNGSIATTVTGGTGSYSYAWSGGAGGANPGGLAAGTYNVTVTDAHSCTTTGLAIVGQPTALSVITSATNVSCNGTGGSIATSVSGGTGTDTYLWSNGQKNANIIGLAIGTYNVTVTDANSCTTTGSATVGQSASVSSTITGNSTVLGGTTNNYNGPSGMATYSWSVSSSDHICDASCHHNSGHHCSSNCDHHGHSCNSACPHNSGYTHSNAAISGSTAGSSVNVFAPCGIATYILTLTTTNSAGCSSTSTMAVTVAASATITVYSSLYTTGSGHHPATTKTALAASLKVFDRHTVGKRDFNQSHYSTTWNGTNGLVPNVSISGPVQVSLGGGPVDQYTITVPANGHYLVIGQSVVPSSACGGAGCTIYTGRKVGGYDAVDGDDDGHNFDDDDDADVTSCSNTTVRFHQVIMDQTGKCTEADTHQEIGSLMLVVTPVALVFTDSVANLPIIYESVEGDWNVSVTADPPYGFYTIPSGALSTSVTDSIMNAVQFVVTDTGSEWTFTKLTHQILHKGAERTAHSVPAMVNERTNKPTQLNIIPNPASDQINIVMSKFEGRATIYIYNLLGQKVAEHPINVISGASVSMDISSLVPGMYIVTAENSSGKAISRLIKNNK